MAEEKQEFKIGDLVRIKSDGPVMTIIDMQNKYEADCIYFVEQTKEFKYVKRLPVAALVPADQKSSGQNIGGYLP